MTFAYITSTIITLVLLVWFIHTINNIHRILKAILTEQRINNDH